MRIAHDSKVNVYSPDGMLFKAMHGSDCGSHVKLYKPFDLDCGILYVQDDMFHGDVALVVHVVLNHELKLCAWGHGNMMGYSIEGEHLHEYNMDVYPQHSRRRTSVLQRTLAGLKLVHAVESALVDLFTGYKMIYYSHKYHENMRKLSLKKAAALKSLLPRDMLEEVAAAHAPSWVFRPLLMELNYIANWNLNVMHKDFLWNFDKADPNTSYWYVWHFAEVPRASWSWFKTRVPLQGNEEMHFPVLDLLLPRQEKDEDQFVRWERTNYTPMRPCIV